MSRDAITALVLFAGSYACFVALPKRRAVVACTGAALLMLSGTLTWQEAVLVCIQWNVIGLFFGTLVLAELFMQSGMPAFLADRLIGKTRTLRGAILAICLLAGWLSMFVENVAVVMLVAPVAFSLARKSGTSPVPLLILVTLSANLQGTATLIGDPPSMILAGHMHMNFNDFFVYHGKVGIFFAVQAGALAALAATAVMLRGHGQRVEVRQPEVIRSLVPSWLIGILVAGLSVASVFDPAFKWLAGTLALGLAVAGLFWWRCHARWGSLRRLVTILDWDTTLFLCGVFVLVGGVSKAGWLEVFSDRLSVLTAGNVAVAFVTIVIVALAVSAFVDNVPFLLAMIPVTQDVAAAMSVEPPLLMFGLLVGACLGGNITPIGASANIVAVGMLRKDGHPVSFREFAALSLPFTLAAVAAGCLFVWIVWAP